MAHPPYQKINTTKKRNAASRPETTRKIQKNPAKELPGARGQLKEPKCDKPHNKTKTNEAGNKPTNHFGNKLRQMINSLTPSVELGKQDVGPPAPIG